MALGRWVLDSHLRVSLASQAITGKRSLLRVMIVSRLEGILSSCVIVLLQPAALVSLLLTPLHLHFHFLKFWTLFKFLVDYDSFRYEAPLALWDFALLSSFWSFENSWIHDDAFAPANLPAGRKAIGVWWVYASWWRGKEKGANDLKVMVSDVKTAFLHCCLRSYMAFEFYSQCFNFLWMRHRCGEVDHAVFSSTWAVHLSSIYSCFSFRCTSVLDHICSCWWLFDCLQFSPLIRLDHRRIAEIDWNRRYESCCSCILQALSFYQPILAWHWETFLLYLIRPP